MNGFDFVHDHCNNINLTECDNKFGEEMNYWSLFGEYKPKYCSLKAEIISNTHYTISISVFDMAYQKARYLTKESNKLKELKADIIPKYNDKLYGMIPNQPINIWNVLAVILYTDYDTLSHHFRCTFYGLSYNQNPRDIRKANNEYFNWSKILIETVHSFGTSISKSNVKSLYHSISNRHTLFNPNFRFSMNAPISMTTKLSIANMYMLSQDEGMMLEFNNYNDISNGDFKYLNCTFFSAFGNECERLFIQNPVASTQYYVKCISIRNMATNENYYELMNALYMFECIISYPNKSIETNLCSSCLKVINYCISTLINNYDTENDSNAVSYVYVSATFNNWRFSVQSISINIEDFNSFCNGISFIRHAKIDKLLRFDKLNMIFKNVEDIQIYSMATIDDYNSFLNAISGIIQNINRLKYSKLKTIKLSGISVIDTESVQKYEAIFKQNGWRLKQHDDHAMMFCKY